MRFCHCEDDEVIRSNLKFKESSETVRRLPKGKDTVRAAWRHAEVSATKHGGFAEHFGESRND